MAWAISSSDIAIYKQAFSAADRGRLEEAHHAARRAKEALPAQVLLWIDLTRPNTDASWEALVAFMARHPDWPNQAALRRNAEARMPATLSSPDVRAWFERNAPLTHAGFDRYIVALMETKASDKAIALVRDRYVNGSFGAVEERDFRGRYVSLLRPEDHVARLDRLLWAGRTDEARRVMPLVSGGQRSLAEARIALAAMSPGVDGAVRRVPAVLAGDAALAYERTRWRRRKDMDDGALELLAVKRPAEEQRTAEWWVERHILARRLMEQGKFKRAYDVVAAHAAKDGLAFAQAEFLAGWLALRRLDKPEAALKHFEALFRGTSSPLSKSRGAYWAGRALAEMGDRQRSTQWFQTATSYGGTFYGLLASDHLDLPAGSTLPAQPEVTDDHRKAFERQEMVRVVELLTRIEGADSDRVALFLRKLTVDARTGENYRLIGDLANRIKRPDLAVITSRAAWQDGFVLAGEGFPLLPGKPPSRPEAALIHGIIRQESNFKTDAVSSAGARGLMQVMPATAGGVAKQQGLKRHTADRLLTDPRHNVEIGSIYLADMIDRFGGSYVLAIAAYNAGPGRVNGWLRAFGDPRGNGVDVIDWIETMPIYETRNYVQRVLENIHLYRARLGGTPSRMTTDLDRGASTNG
ncbi:lytic transglycosylase domain-containing protein [Niveispirillum fermenti]|uniref:lytic transglycosylase domain-containing protein n=1 Tax=Niveispirillum fermenti TaxID=1233113 RepID=UPI003A89B721